MTVRGGDCRKHEDPGRESRYIKASKRKAIGSAFGKVKSIERVRTNILFHRPYGDISVSDIKLGGWCRFCVARVPDEKFFELAGMS